MEKKDVEKVWYPYFKQTMRKHESGYRMFEVGYITRDGEIHKIGACSDVINIGNIFMDNNMRCHLDILDSGHIRIISSDVYKSIKWIHERFGMSDAELEYGEPNII